MQVTVGPVRTSPPRRNRPTCGSAAWSEITTSDELDQRSRPDGINPCSKAKAAAAVREVTASLTKMFCTCRATVWGLMTNSAAMWALLPPAASNCRTSTSREVRPPGRLSVCAVPDNSSRRASCGVAPSRPNTSLAASSSIAALSSSPC